MLVELARALGTGGIVERGPASAPDVAVQGELRDGKNCSPGLGDIEVHLAIGIFKNPQRADLLGQVFGIGFRVGGCNPEQHQKSVANVSDGLVLHDYAGAADALHDGSHAMSITTKSNERHADEPEAAISRPAGCGFRHARPARWR